MKFDVRGFETGLLAILLLNALRAFQVTNQLILIVMAALMVLFYLSRSLQKRIAIVLAIAVITLSSILALRINSRISGEEPYIHDGALITEEAFRGLMAGQNPYSIKFDEAFKKTIYGKEILSDKGETHYTYSPLMFIIQVPIFTLTNAFGIVDARVGATIFFMIAGLFAVKLVANKILFLIVFFLNPLFLHSIFDGANEAFLLFFISLVFFYLIRQKFVFSTAILGLAAGTKLLILPFIPLYFLYLTLKLPKKILRQELIKHTAIILLFILLIYLPFVLWNTKDFLSDVILYHIQGGSSGRSIAGFLGVPQLLASVGFVDKQSSAPFFTLALLVSSIFLVWSYRFLKRSTTVSRLCFLFCVHFILILAFSRIIQTDYLSFLSQVFILGSLLDENHA